MTTESNRAVLDGDAYPEYMMLARALRHEEDAWMRRGNCRKERRGPGTERFWVMKRDDPDYSEEGATLAKQLCAICPVQWDCAFFALQERQEFQIWGGMDAKLRRRLRKEKDWPALLEEAQTQGCPVEWLGAVVEERRAQRKAEREARILDPHVLA